MYIVFFFFFFNDTATTEIYTLSLHDALPISDRERRICGLQQDVECPAVGPDACPQHLEGLQRRLRQWRRGRPRGDRKSTRLNSSHGYISYAVFCLKKKKKNHSYTHQHKTDS